MRIKWQLYAICLVFILNSYKRKVTFQGLQPVLQKLLIDLPYQMYSKPIWLHNGVSHLLYANINTATIKFAAGTANELNTINNAPLKQYFFLDGIDQVFNRATAVISGNQIIVTAPADVPLPIQAIRYAFTNAPVTNLQNLAALPVEPFRTDNWAN